MKAGDRPPKHEVAREKINLKMAEYIKLHDRPLMFTPHVRGFVDMLLKIASETEDTGDIDDNAKKDKT